MVCGDFGPGGAAKAPITRHGDALLNAAGWCVNHKRVERIRRREGLKVPQTQKNRSRLWLNDGSCIRLRPERPNHVWSYDVMQDRTHGGRAFRPLDIIDEFTKAALVIRPGRKLNSTDGQVERMNRTIKDATVKRFHYDSHDQLRTHLTDFMAASTSPGGSRRSEGSHPTNTSARSGPPSRIDSSSTRSTRCRD